jgi:FAD/FMN-containing dehydrogenase
VRPVLNLRLEKDVKAMRAIAEEAFELVRGYGGSHSGEHGDGIVRSEFHETDVRPPHGGTVPGGEGPLRSERHPQSGPHRAPAAHG